MNNLPLQPLKWAQKNLNPLAELELTAYSALHEYVITEPKQGRFELKKTRLSRPDKKSEFLENFDTVKEAKDWAWAHYQRSMQPYVKPSPTWIDASKQLPSHQQEVIVYRYNESEGATIEYSLYFNADYFNDDGMIGFGNVKNGGDFLTDVYYWQSIETKDLYEAMAMQLQIKGE